LGCSARRRLGSQRPFAWHSAPRRQGVHRAGWRRDAHPAQRLIMIRLSILLGILAALADVAGGLVLVRARGIERYLRYFVAVGAGFLMATALLEMTPESLRLNARLAPALIMLGYCVMH